MKKATGPGTNIPAHHANLAKPVLSHGPRTFPQPRCRRFSAHQPKRPNHLPCPVFQNRAVPVFCSPGPDSPTACPAPFSTNRAVAGLLLTSLRERNHLPRPVFQNRAVADFLLTRPRQPNCLPYAVFPKPRCRRFSAPYTQRRPTLKIARSGFTVNLLKNHHPNQFSTILNTADLPSQGHQTPPCSFPET